MVLVSQMFDVAFFLDLLENLHLCYPRLDLGREKEGVNFIFSQQELIESCIRLQARNLSQGA